MQARLGNVTLQIIRDWVMRFNERGPQGLIDGKAPGQQSRLNDQQRAALVQAIERGPIPYLDGVVRWRLCDLAQWLWEEFRVSVSEQTLSREVRAMGYRKLAARPKHHAQDPQAIEDFKKVSPPVCKRILRCSDQSASTYTVSWVAPMAKMDIRAFRAP
jgi:transposase